MTTSPSGGPDGARLTWVGNATMLLHLGPFTLLTDPNFLHRGQRAYLGYGLTSKRLQPPAYAIDALPPLDAVLLSHAHGDHWDRVARRGLSHDLPVLTTPHAARRLTRDGFRAARAMATWQTERLEKDGAELRVTSLPGRHAVGLVGRLLPPVMGSLLEYRPDPDRVALQLYITGDTLLVPELAEIPRRYPDLDVSVLHLGGTTLPGGIVVTMDGRQGADLVDLLPSPTVVPVHYDDYTVFKSPLSDFAAELRRRGTQDRMRVVGRGETVDLPVRPA